MYIEISLQTSLACNAPWYKGNKNIWYCLHVQILVCILGPEDMNSIQVIPATMLPSLEFNRITFEQGM